MASAATVSLLSDSVALDILLDLIEDEGRSCFKALKWRSAVDPQQKAFAVPGYLHPTFKTTQANWYSTTPTGN